MSHFEDRLRTGRGGSAFDVRAPLRSAQYASGVELANNPAYVASPYQPGVAIGNLTGYNLQPSAAGVSSLAAAATLSNAGATFSSALTTTTYNGVTYYDLGVARCLLVSGAATSVTAVNFTAMGMDNYYQPQTAFFSGPTGTAAITTLKAFRFLQAVTALGNTVSSVSIGVSDVIGLSHRLDAVGQLNYNWNNTWQTSSAGVTIADSTSPATSATGDVRGTVALPSVSSNGTLRLFIQQDASITDRLDNIYGVIPA
jgi:hypothetical protein